MIGSQQERFVSVVVCANSNERRELLFDAVRSLEQQDAPPDEIICVIDHNPQLLAELAEHFPAVRTVANAGCPGLSAARNMGIRTARGEIIAFMDDDALASPNWLSGLVQHYRDPRVMAVGGAVIAAWPGGRRPSWFPPEFNWVVGCSYQGQPTSVTAVRNLLGCNMSFRRVVFDQVGLFAESLGRGGNDGAGCEETELCIRALQCFPSARILYDPSPSVHHRVAPERVSRRYFRSRCLAEGRSKASMVLATGTASGLASERSHALLTLPAGVARGIAEAASGNISGLARSVAILMGFAFTVAAFVGARLTKRGHEAAKIAHRPSFPPMRVLELDLDRPLTSISATHPDTGERYYQAFCLIRAGGRPIQVAEFPMFERHLEADQLRELVGSSKPVLPPARPRQDETAPFISVVVATRDRPESLGQCLDSVLRQDYPAFDVVIVDNAPSSNQTAEMIATRFAGDRRIRYLREDRAGLGRAHNRGVDSIASQFISFTDDDVIVDEHWLRAIASNFSQSSRIGCVTGLILPAELKTRAQYWTERHGGFGKGFERRVFDLSENRPPDRLFPFAAGSFGSGANMAFRTEALRRIGGFDAALGAGTLAKGGDDLAAFVSIIRAGYQLVYEPEALVWHHHRSDEEGMARQAYGYGVGLGSYLMKTLIDDPFVLRDFVRAAPWAITHLFSPASSKNSGLPADYPAVLKWKERLGVGVGFSAYMRSRSAERRHVQPAVVNVDG